MLDDFQNLPLTSMIATGDIPPHFILDPDVSFGYHYFSLLFAAQLMHIADVYVWTALDLARGLGFTLGLMLSALFVQRVTGSRLAGLAGGMMTAFAGGTRWLLLLFPEGLLQKLGADLQMIGSGAHTAPDLVAAMTSQWAATGMGPFPFPFAFINGFNPAGVITYHAGAGGLTTLIAALLLLLHNKWKGWRAWLVMTALLASAGLANEVQLAEICVGVVLVLLVFLLVRRSWRFPVSLWRWAAVAFAAGLIALFQGGVLTSLVQDRLISILPGSPAAASAYHTFQFSLFWPPKVLSSHLGYLSLTDPAQLLLALVEIGPILLVTPLVLAWMVKALRYQRWYECMLVCAGTASLGLFVVELSGPAGLTALTRAQSLFIGVLQTFAVPSLWLWARRRSDKIKAWCGAFLAVSIYGGLVLFGFSLIAAARPVASDFLTLTDIKMTALYWDQLEEDALVFDTETSRSPVIFGRPSNAAYDWFNRKPEWLALRENPDPAALRAAGYRYLYLDDQYWQSLTEEQKAALQAPCVKVVHEETLFFPSEMRRLLEVSECR